MDFQDDLSKIRIIVGPINRESIRFGDKPGVIFKDDSVHPCVRIQTDSGHKAGILESLTQTGLKVATNEDVKMPESPDYENGGVLYIPRDGDNASILADISLPAIPRGRNA